MYIKPLNSLFKSLQKGNSAKLLYFPAKISIETGNICNLRCPLCPTNADDQKHVEKGMMKLEDFKVIFDRIKPFVKTIDLFNWGEPFLNKDIARIIKYAREERPDLRMFIDSNLNVIDDGQTEAIVGYKLDVLKVSCDGATQKVYEKYRVGGDVERVMLNVGKVIAKKKAMGSDRPVIVWKYLVFKHNSDEVEKARKTAQKMGIGFEASGMRVDCGREIFEKVEDSVKRDKNWIPDDPAYNNYADLAPRKTRCAKPWTTLTVNWNGDVVPCGAVYDCSKYSFGNLLTESFKDIWNGKKFVAARNTILGRRSCGDDVICAVCKRNGYQYF